MKLNLNGLESVNKQTQIRIHLLRLHSDSCSGLITPRMCILMFVSCSRTPSRSPVLSLSSDTIQTLLEDSQIREDYCPSSRAAKNTDKPCEVFSMSLHSHLSVCSGCDKCLLLSCILIWTSSFVSLSEQLNINTWLQTFRHLDENQQHQCLTWQWFSTEMGHLVRKHNQINQILNGLVPVNIKSKKILLYEHFTISFEQKLLSETHRTSKVFTT